MRCTCISLEAYQSPLVVPNKQLKSRHNVESDPPPTGKNTAQLRSVYNQLRKVK